MAKNVAFIINPASGFGKTKKRLKDIRKEVKDQCPSARILLTRHRMHAMNVAKDCLDKGVERIVVIGGDGTLNEVVNGFFDFEGKPINKSAQLATIPGGSGSDFIKSIPKKESLAAYIDFAINGSALPTDIGSVEAKSPRGQDVQRYFINIASFGISGLVAGFIDKTTRSFGATVAYFLATVRAVREFQRPKVRLELGDGTIKEIEHCSLAAFCNGRYFGSGMQLAPHALFDDGKFDVVTVSDMNLMFFLTHGPKVYKGEHLHVESVHSSRSERCVATAEGDEPVFIETDGELFAKLPATFRVLKQEMLVVR